MLDQNTMPGHLARRFQQIAVAAFYEQVSSLGFDLTPVQYSALVAVCEHTMIEQNRLGEVIAVDPATMTGVIDRLVAKGLLERKVNSSDRRARAVHITPAGREFLAAVQPAVDQAQATITQALTRNERENLSVLIGKIIRNYETRAM